MKEYHGHEWWRLVQIASKVQVKFFKIPKNCQMALWLTFSWSTTQNFSRSQHLINWLIALNYLHIRPHSQFLYIYLLFKFHL